MIKCFVHRISENSKEKKKKERKEGWGLKKTSKMIVNKIYLNSMNCCSSETQYVNDYYSSDLNHLLFLLPSGSTPQCFTLEKWSEYITSLSPFTSITLLFLTGKEMHAEVDTLIHSYGCLVLIDRTDTRTHTQLTITGLSAGPGNYWLCVWQWTARWCLSLFNVWLPAWGDGGHENLQPPWESHRETHLSLSATKA